MPSISRRLYKAVFFCLFVLGVAGLRPALAETLFVVLSADGQKQFAVTEEVIDKVGTTSFKSVLPSTDEPFYVVRGPLLRDIVAASGFKGSSVTVQAFDGYEMDIPGDDYMKNDVILAIETNGKRLTRRDRGPAWIAYPSVEFPEFQGDGYAARSVWQVKDIIVK
ncbi:molybdopterin-dependent oxidoreductase [Allorhizobium borbori]|uniref:Oxidoreductase molybdopterin-binding domain-containing protein n=1 Tax=Allorhizobium borbori TaxID=485907 RepID=A0A7W6K433_9HYPH|nr:molybdopterin-dependent oxidoreductase [Allorhizobium borbori]MBB4104803.1 hypothetical protein [Allorhizobium borbori]